MDDDSLPKARCVYQSLMSEIAPEDLNAFDAHVFASSLSMAASEGRDDVPSILAGTGLDARSLAELLSTQFPRSRNRFARSEATSDPAVPPEEACLRDLLTRNTTDGLQVEQWLAAIVARRAQRPNHLWQDLGLRERAELSRLMSIHFAPLAECNTRDMKWKKFLYRAICESEGLSICTAPCCSECSDMTSCFGDERGSSLVSVRVEQARSDIR